MYIIQIESSHERGMGHFYRALNIVEYLERRGRRALILANADPQTVCLLKQKKVSHIILDYNELGQEQVNRIVLENYIKVWILDRFETGYELCQYIKMQNVLLVGIDDKGQGAALFDLHFASLLFDSVKGKKIFRGKDYLILNPEIKKFYRIREQINKIIVTMGGSDTHGVTKRVIGILKEKGFSADIVLGPNYQRDTALENEINSDYQIFSNVPSLIEKFWEYDLAITGGGITCIEANTSGLPCIIIANEKHEIQIGRYVAGFGGAIFAGYYKHIIEEKFQIETFDVKKMSLAAGREFTLDGLDNMFRIIDDYTKTYNDLI